MLNVRSAVGCWTQILSLKHEQQRLALSSPSVCPRGRTDEVHSAPPVKGAADRPLWHTDMGCMLFVYGKESEYPEETHVCTRRGDSAGKSENEK